MPGMAFRAQATMPSVAFRAQATMSGVAFTAQLGGRTGPSRAQLTSVMRGFVHLLLVLDSSSHWLS